MNVFEAVKQSVTTRQAAEHYAVQGAKGAKEAGEAGESTMSATVKKTRKKLMQREFAEAAARSRQRKLQTGQERSAKS